MGRVWAMRDPPLVMVQTAVRSRPRGGRKTEWAFIFRLENEDGSPVKPPTLRTAIPNWRAGDTIPLGRKTLRIVDIRDADADQPPILVVQDVLRDR